MNSFTIINNRILSEDVQAFYHTEFNRRLPNHPYFLYKLKNDPHHNWSNFQLNQAKENLTNILRQELPQIISTTNYDSLTVCVIPRAKADQTYNSNQLLFKSTISKVVNELSSNFKDGTNYITRHTNTRTTHLRRPITGYHNDGLCPYSGITNDTCFISNNVSGKNILLIDDIYTKTVNIDEDAIQALLAKNANSVTFYAIGKTVRIN